MASFAAVQWKKAIVIPIVRDLVYERDEQFQALLSSASRALIGRGAGTGAILTDYLIGTTASLTSTPNPSDVGEHVELNVPISASSGTTAGAVTFSDGATHRGSAVLVGGQGSLDVRSLASGSSASSLSYRSRSLWLGGEDSWTVLLGPIRNARLGTRP